MRGVVCLFAVVMALLSGSALAQREPCSGSHGGVVRCEGETFVCADGEVSKSKKVCQASDYAPVALKAAGQLQEKKESSYTIISWVGVVAGFFIVGVCTVLVMMFRGGRGLVLRIRNKIDSQRD